LINKNIIAKKVLREFWKTHTDSEQQLKSWFQEAVDSLTQNLVQQKAMN
jgi:mRNA interferase HigB